MPPERNHSKTSRKSRRQGNEFIPGKTRDSARGVMHNQTGQKRTSTKSGRLSPNLLSNLIAPKSYPPHPLYIAASSTSPPTLHLPPFDELAVSQQQKKPEIRSSQRPSSPEVATSNAPQIQIQVHPPSPSKPKSQSNKGFLEQDKIHQDDVLDQEKLMPSGSAFSGSPSSILPPPLSQSQPELQKQPEPQSRSRLPLGLHLQSKGQPLLLSQSAPGGFPTSSLKPVVDGTVDKFTNIRLPKLPHYYSLSSSLHLTTLSHRTNTTVRREDFYNHMGKLNKEVGWLEGEEPMERIEWEEVDFGTEGKEAGNRDGNKVEGKGESGKKNTKNEMIGRWMKESSTGTGGILPEGAAKSTIASNISNVDDEGVETGWTLKRRRDEWEREGERLERRDFKRRRENARLEKVMIERERLEKVQLGGKEQRKEGGEVRENAEEKSGDVEIQRSKEAKSSVGNSEGISEPQVQEPIAPSPELLPPPSLPDSPTIITSNGQKSGNRIQTPSLILDLLRQTKSNPSSRKATATRDSPKSPPSANFPVRASVSSPDSKALNDLVGCLAHRPQRKSLAGVWLRANEVHPFPAREDPKPEEAIVAEENEKGDDRIVNVPKEGKVTNGSKFGIFEDHHAMAGEPQNKEGPTITISSPTELPSSPTQRNSSPPPGLASNIEDDLRGRAKKAKTDPGPRRDKDKGKEPTLQQEVDPSPPTIHWSCRPGGAPNQIKLPGKANKSNSDPIRPSVPVPSISAAAVTADASSLVISGSDFFYHPRPSLSLSMAPKVLSKPIKRPPTPPAKHLRTKCPTIQDYVQLLREQKDAEDLEAERKKWVKQHGIPTQTANNSLGKGRGKRKREEQEPQIQHQQPNITVSRSVRKGMFSNFRFLFINPLVPAPSKTLTSTSTTKGKSKTSLSSSTGASGRLQNQLTQKIAIRMHSAARRDAVLQEDFVSPALIANADGTNPDLSWLLDDPEQANTRPTTHIFVPEEIPLPTMLRSSPRKKEKYLRVILAALGPQAVEMGEKALQGVKIVWPKWFEWNVSHGKRDSIMDFETDTWDFADEAGRKREKAQAKIKGIGKEAKRVSRGLDYESQETDHGSQNDLEGSSPPRPQPPSLGKPNIRSPLVKLLDQDWEHDAAALDPSSVSSVDITKALATSTQVGPFYRGNERSKDPPCEGIPVWTCDGSGSEDEEIIPETPPSLQNDDKPMNPPMFSAMQAGFSTSISDPVSTKNAHVSTGSTSLVVLDRKSKKGPDDSEEIEDSLELDPGQFEQADVLFKDLNDEIELARMGEDDEHESSTRPDGNQSDNIIYDFRSNPLDSDDVATDEEETRRQKKGKPTIKAKGVSRNNAAPLKGTRRDFPPGAFTCDRKNDKGERKVGPNEDICEALEKIKSYYNGTSEEKWKAYATSKAIGALRNHPKRIETYSEAIKLKNVGELIAKKIHEIAKTGTHRRLKFLTPEEKAGAIFQGIYGVGPSVADQWAQRGLRTLEDVRARKGGIHLHRAQIIGLDHYDDLKQRIPREEASNIYERIRVVAFGIDPKLELYIMGSYRRGAPNCGDIDIIITRNDSDGISHEGKIRRLHSTLHEQGLLTHDLTIPDDWDALDVKYNGLCKLNPTSIARRIDFLGVPYHELGAALIYFTGNDIFNRSLRLKARRMGFSLNQRGLFKDVLRKKNGEKITEGTLVASRTEEEIFNILRVKLRPPEHRNP